MRYVDDDLDYQAEELALQSKLKRVRLHHNFAAAVHPVLAPTTGDLCMLPDEILTRIATYVLHSARSQSANLKVASVCSYVNLFSVCRHMRQLYVRLPHTPLRMMCAQTSRPCVKHMMWFVLLDYSMAEWRTVRFGSSTNSDVNISCCKMTGAHTEFYAHEYTSYLHVITNSNTWMLSMGQPTDRWSRELRAKLAVTLGPW